MEALKRRIEDPSTSTCGAGSEPIGYPNLYPLVQGAPKRKFGKYCDGQPIACKAIREKWGRPTQLKCLYCGAKGHIKWEWKCRHKKKLPLSYCGQLWEMVHCSTSSRYHNLPRYQTNSVCVPNWRYCRRISGN